MVRRVVRTGLVRGLLVLTTSLAVVTASACSNGSSASSKPPTTPIPGITQDEITAAQQEGHLTIYSGTWQPSELAVIAGFKKRYPGITVENFTATVGQLQQKYVSEANAGKTTADIVQNSSPGQLDDEAAQGLLMKYTSSQDDAYAADEKSSGNWYAIRLALIGIAWNTDDVSDSQAASIKTVSDLTDPKWKGKIGLIDPSGGGVDFLPWYLWSTDPSLGTPFLKKLAANKPRIYSATNPASQALASGDISVLVNASETGLEPLAAKSAPIQWKFTNPAWGLPTGQAITAKAPHPAAAKLFQDYSLSAEGAALFQAAGGAPARTGLVDHREIAKQSWYHLPTSLAPYDEAAASKDQASLLATVKSLFK